MARPIAYVTHHNHIFHPLVHPKTRQINLDYDFPEWKPGHHWAIHILLSIKKMLHLEPFFKLENKEHLVWNKEAHDAFCNRFEEEFVERCNQCVARSNEDKFKEAKDVNGEVNSCLLKFQEWDPIHETVGQKINEAVDSIAIERELELEDEDALIEKKKQDLKKWFIHNYSHELNKRQAAGPAPTGEAGQGSNLAFQNLINVASENIEK